MKIIAGLGNPTKEYEGTRHNVGFMVMDALADQTGIDISIDKHKALCGKGTIGGEKVLLMKPQTYMNLSGEAIFDAVRFYKCDPKEDVIVIYDDIALDVGRIRIRKQGSAGGHNGMKNIIAHLGTQEFLRVRVGVGAKPPKWSLVDYVLSGFTGEDADKIGDAILTAAESVQAILTDGADRAMNQYNQ